jgi:uncharacterized SAM-binding protein YcdF (DUF218 family)
VAPERVLVEPTSRNTRENARQTAILAAEHGLGRLLLVTSALHMRRAVLCFRAEGLDVVPYPTDYVARDPTASPSVLVPSEEGLLEMRRLWREVFGIAGYALAGWLRPPAEPAGVGSR